VSPGARIRAVEKSLACAGCGPHIDTEKPSDGFGHECRRSGGHCKHLLRTIGNSNVGDARICEVGKTLKRPRSWGNRSNEGSALNILKPSPFSFLKSLHSRKTTLKMRVCTVRAAHR
jgi:hypothetical protein